MVKRTKSSLALSFFLIEGGQTGRGYLSFFQRFGQKRELCSLLLFGTASSGREQGLSLPTRTCVQERNYRALERGQRKIAGEIGGGQTQTTIWAGRLWRWSA